MCADPAPEPPDQLVGEVVWIVFTNPSSGFGVVELTGDGKADGARASGPLAGLAEGQPVRLIGRWVEHPRHGPTFEALSYETAPPQSTASLAAFLASDRFSGVGATLAHRLVDAFGLDLPDIIRDDHLALATVTGVSARLAASIADDWAEAGALATLVARLGDAGIAAPIAHAAHRRLGDDALDDLTEDPYRLIEARGAGWDHAERWARHLEVARDDPRRLRAAAVVAHSAACGRLGHLALGDGELIAAAARTAGVDAVLARTGIDGAVAQDLLVHDVDVADEPLWYRPVDRFAEVSIADDIDRLLGGTSRLRAAARAGIDDPELTATQVAAATAALEWPVTVLTGGPGTGKTRTTQAILDACERAGAQVALCAPTGRAAKRLEEVTGRGATTIHRLLEARPEAGAGFTFGYDRERSLPHDLVIADEWSMTDVHLARALLAAIEEGSHLLCVGDPHQLPPVGPGAVLRDLLAAAQGPDGDREPGRPVAVRLTEVHRQAAESRIVTLAHQIDVAAVPPLSGRDGDVFCVPERAPQIPARVAEIVAVRAPSHFGCAPSDVQVLAPMYRGPAGVDALNTAIGERVNPAQGRPAVAGFREGDRVLQTRNDPERDIANGDIGEVTGVEVAARRLSLAFPTGETTAEGDQLDDLRPAWAMTVHKSQGGEWPVVVVVLDRSMRVMLRRELVYTAVTRARLGLLLVGTPDLVAQAAADADGGLGLRRTGLAARLEAIAAASAAAHT